MPSLKLKFPNPGSTALKETQRARSGLRQGHISQHNTRDSTPVMLPSIPLSLLLWPLLVVSASLSPQNIRISAQRTSGDGENGPLTPYLDIHYDPSSLTASVLKTYSLDAATADDANPNAPSLALGFHRPSSKHALPADADASWTAIHLPPSALLGSRNRTLTLLLDRAARPHHLAFTSRPPTPSTGDDHEAGKRPAKNAPPPDGALEVRCEQIQAGPAPVLNRPVVLNREGKVAGSEQEEKGFLQKYWWAIAIFLLIQVALGGGGEGK